MRKRTKRDIEKELRVYQKKYERIKARIQKIGFISKGSLSERRLPCGNPNCCCHKDPTKKHGPYYQLSWKEKGKTISHFLAPENVRLYRGWIDNRRKLLKLIGEMEAVSRKAGECIRTKDRRQRKPSKTGKKKANTRKNAG